MNKYGQIKLLKDDHQYKLQGQDLEINLLRPIRILVRFKKDHSDYERIVFI